MKKNNKKGFTLVELLAVIVILAILATAAFTLVIPRVRKARRDTFITEAASMIDAAETYFVQHGDSSCVTVQKLMEEELIGVKGSKDDYAGYIKKDDSNEFTVNVTNGTWYTDGELTSDKLSVETAMAEDDDNHGFTDEDPSTIYIDKTNKKAGVDESSAVACDLSSSETE